jgi:hypothetical protein
MVALIVCSKEHIQDEGARISLKKIREVASRRGKKGNERGRVSCLGKMLRPFILAP